MLESITASVAGLLVFCAQAEHIINNTAVKTHINLFISNIQHLLKYALKQVYTGNSVFGRREFALQRVAVHQLNHMAYLEAEAIVKIRVKAFGFPA
jgi:hypothetical protein